MRLSEMICNEPPPHACGTQKIHSMTLYRDRSGALVFSAGTIQWAFGLEDAAPFLTAMNQVLPHATNPDQRMQQATMNLLIDLEGVPATPMGTLGLEPQHRHHRTYGDIGITTNRTRRVS